MSQSSTNGSARIVTKSGMRERNTIPKILSLKRGIISIIKDYLTKSSNVMDDVRKELIGEKVGKLIGIIGGFFLRSWLIMLVWNAVATSLFDAHALTYWYACGLNLLTGWLFRWHRHERED